jgi:hypothetical protein
LNTKKELEEDLGIKPDSKKIPNINQLAENIKTLPPEKKTQLIEFAKQHGTLEHLLKRLGLV